MSSEEYRNLSGFLSSHRRWRWLRPATAATACPSCHMEAKSQPATSMAHALETAEECRILSGHPLLTFKDARYSYRIERRGDQSSCSVSDGAQILTVPIRWAMGSYFLLGATGMLFYSKVGELALRERLLDSIPWCGTKEFWMWGADAGC